MKTKIRKYKLANIQYPDYEQSFLFEGYKNIETIPAAGLIMTEDYKGNIVFHDDEYPALTQPTNINKYYNESR